MAKTLLVTASANLAATSAATEYWALSNCTLGRSATEAHKQILYRSPGVLSNLYVRVTANAANTARTLNVRKNGADGNQIVTIGIGATGIFEDTTHTDTVAAGDLLAYQTITPGAGATTFGIMSNVFDATTNTVTRLSITALGTSAGVAYATASQTTYNQLAGELASNVTAELSGQTTFRKAGTLKNLAVYVSANARTTNTVIRSRKNLAAGNQVVTFGSGITGWLEDTTNSDTIAVGDELDYQTVTSTGTQTLTMQSCSCDFETTTGKNGICLSSRTAATVPGPSVTNYYPISGGLATDTTESNKQMKMRGAYTFSELSANVSANTITANSTLKLRKNTADATQLITIASSTTGFFSDSTNTDFIISTDDVDYQLITGATGTTITIRQIATWVREQSALPLSDTITVSEPSMVRLATKARTKVETESIDEAVAKIKAAIRALATQTVTISEASLTRINAAIKALSDTITIGEAVATIRAKIRALSQTITIGESIARIAAKIRALATQSITVGEAVARINAATKALSDTITIGEAIARVLGKVRALSDTKTIGEAMDNLIGKIRALAAQTITLTDDVVRVVTPAGGANIVKTLSDTIVVSELRARLKAVWRLQP